MAKKKRKPWYEKHHEECNNLRAQFGVAEGDGLRIFNQMKTSEYPEVYDMYKFLEGCARRSFWSVDYLDAYVAVMMSNPVFKRIVDVGMERTRQEVQAKCQSSETKN